MNISQDVKSSKKNKPMTLTDLCKDCGNVVKQFFPNKNSGFILTPHVGKFK